jgi:hypothetical protein
LVTNPHAIPVCETKKLLEEEKCPANSLLGIDKLVVYNPIKEEDEEHTYNVFNLVPPSTRPADYAFMTPTGPIELLGGVSWYNESKIVSGVPTGDSHQFFEIKNIFRPAPLVSSTLILFCTPEAVSSGGKALGNAFIRVPTSCLGPAATYLQVKSYEGQTKNYTFTPTPPQSPVTLQTTGCGNVPFEPALSVSPETRQSDAPDGATVEVTVPQSQSPLTLASAHLKTAKVTLPEGMTLNPSAASELDGCTPEQIGLGTVGHRERGGQIPGGAASGRADRRRGRRTDRQHLPGQARDRRDRRTAVHDLPGGRIGRIRPGDAPAGDDRTESHHRPAHDDVR